MGTMLVTGYGEGNGVGACIARDCTGCYIRLTKIQYFSCIFI